MLVWESVLVHLIDRRVQGKNKSAPNRDRFLRRYKEQIKEAVARAIKGRSITDIESGEKISIPVKDVNEPQFGHAKGGIWESVNPGNKEFQKGDQVARPSGGSGAGRGKASNSEDTGEDEFIFQLSREEFLNYFFEDLELPNLIKTQLTAAIDFKNQRAGFKSSGTSSTLHVLRSLRGALGRRIAVGGKSSRRLKEIEKEINLLLNAGIEQEDERIVLLKEEAHHLRIRLLSIPFLDTFDLRYSNRIKVPKPSTQAVIFCMLDVSGSMTEDKKDIAKRFFILLYLFLKRAYEKIDVVFIRHHTSAKEVDEEEFFNSRETGGTIVSSALTLLHDTIKKRYPSSDWNAYVAQASDGDNWDNDSTLCKKLMVNHIMPLVQYYAYVEITDGAPQNLWEEFSKIKDHHTHFAMQKIQQTNEIYPVFRELFKKQAK